MRPLIASTPMTMRDSCRQLVLDNAGESASNTGRISGMGFRPPQVDELALTTSIRKPYSLSSTARRFGEGIVKGFIYQGSYLVNAYSRDTLCHCWNGRRKVTESSFRRRRNLLFSSYTQIPCELPRNRPSNVYGSSSLQAEKADASQA